MDNYYRGQKVRITDSRGVLHEGKYQGFIGSNYHIVNGKKVKISN